MSNERVVVKFAQSWRGYSKGECAGFDEVQAKALVDGGVAELAKGGKAAAKVGGKGGSAKVQAQGTDTPPNETPPSDDDTPPGDDDEPKP